MKTLLFVLVSFVALTSFFSGLLLISNPDGSILNLPLSLLQTSPFKNFLIPGIVLAVLVGGVNLAAVFQNLQRRPNRYNWAIAGGFMICGWILVQAVMIDSFNWLHFTYLACGLLIILTGWQLKGKWAV